MSSTTSEVRKLVEIGGTRSMLSASVESKARYVEATHFGWRKWDSEVVTMNTVVVYPPRVNDGNSEGMEGGRMRC